MAEKSSRIVFAIYSSREEAEKAYRKVCSARRGRCLLLTPNARPKPQSTLSRYAALQFEGENALLVESPPSEVQGIVGELRRAGESSIFILAGPAAEALPAITVKASSLSIEEMARECSQRHNASPLLKKEILSRLRACENGLETVRGSLAQAARLDHTLTASAEWLLDNAYLTRTSIAEIRRSLPRNHIRSHSGQYGFLCVYELAADLARYSDNVLDEANISQALAEYQRWTPLSIAELWSFPLLLRLSLIESLAALAGGVDRAQQIREAGYFWANRLAVSSRRDPKLFAGILRLMESEPLARQPYFATCLVEQLQDEDRALAPAQQWIEAQLGTPLAEVVRNEHNREAAERLSIANAFGSLRTLARLDFRKVFEATSLVEAELRSDPTHTHSDFATRDRSRKVVEHISRHSGTEELAVARRAIFLSRQGNRPEATSVSYFLLAEGVTELERDVAARMPFRIRITRAVRRRATPLYLGSLTALTAWFLALSLAFAWDLGVRQPWMLAILGTLAVFPLSELTVQIINALVISLLPPDPLPKMEYQDGIPSDHATLVVVPMMLSSTEVVRLEVEKLEVRYLANQDPNVFFGLFSDFTDSPEAAAFGDGEVLAAARHGIEQLNSRYSGGRFLLFHRPRVWSASERRWIGRERKRGKLEDLNAFLCGEGDPSIKIVGDLPLPIRYVITLDADTQLPPGSGRRMIETLAHPLNQAVLDPVTRVRKRGYGIIQPRVSISLPGATATHFTRVFADTLGTDPYCQTVSDAQQDLFGEAIFHGKAIYDVRSFRQSVGDRFPPETLLSHDLIEGAYAGVGLASDIELFEQMPCDYASYSKRQHRWIRGDWQIAPWMLGRVPSANGGWERNPLSLINRWRIFDNLRRSLVPSASMLLLLFGWLTSKAPGVWSLLVGLAVAIPAVAPLFERSARYLHGSIRGWRGAFDEVVRAAVLLAFLPHQAWLSGDAIVRVTYRRWFSRHHLLEWQTTDSASRTQSQLNTTMRHMLVVYGFAVVLMIVMQLQDTFGPTALFLVLWAVSPFLMHWLSRPARDSRRHRFEIGSNTFLRSLARRTWRFFDDLLGPAMNWLPPDNTQLSLHVEVAPRTSPTNIGLWLTSALAARDFGYLTPDDFWRRCSQTMTTLDRLERYEGHLLNWYDTRTLAPLEPRYVSTADSGNLLACLWVLEQGCQDTARAPVLGHQSLRGLADTLGVLRDACGTDSLAAVHMNVLRRLLRGKPEGYAVIGRLRLALAPIQQLREIQHGEEAGYWASRLESELHSWTETVDLYLKWMETLMRAPEATVRVLGEHVGKLRRRAVRMIPSLKGLASGHSGPVDEILTRRMDPGLPSEVAGWLNQLSAEYQEARANAARIVANLEQLAVSAESLATGMNMRFLYDKERRMFAIGYAVGAPAEFTSHYDLLASESRIASLVAMAKGDVPVEHWFSLARPCVPSPGGQTLLSWSGTAFEYLMPALFTRLFANSLLEDACRDCVGRQIDYGNRMNVPWGISESAYSALDASQTYQYQAFGVPQLALKPGLDAEGLVISPYSTMLALPVEPGAAVANLKRLEDLGLMGPMGFYEAIDYTRTAKRQGERGVIIYAYMAHHQGMSLLALDNTVHRLVMQRRFHADLRIRAIESVLFERIPLTNSSLEKTPSPTPAIRPSSADEPAERILKGTSAVPRVHFYGNGRYSLMVTDSGGSYSRWNDLDLSRWRSDTTLDAWGSFLYIRDTRSDAVWAAAAKPVGSQLGSAEVRFSADRAEYHRQVFGIETIMEVTVAPEDDVELRRVKVFNRSIRTRPLEFTSYCELALTAHAADKAHPAFAKMFIETERTPDDLLLAHRRQRSPDEAQVWSAHFLIGASGDLQSETDRAKFLGRGNTVEFAEALRRPLTGSAGIVLDPVFSLRCRAALEPLHQIELVLVTLIANSREQALALAAKYRRPESIARAFEMAWTRSQLEFRYLGIGPAKSHRFQELAGNLLYSNPNLRVQGARLQRNRLGQPALWGYGISGDLPILTVIIADVRSLPLVRELLLAHTYWQMRGFRTDLIVLNQEGPSYEHPLHHQLQRQIDAHSRNAGNNQRGGVFLIDWNELPEAQVDLLLSTSRVVLSGSRGSLQQQLSIGGKSPEQPAFIRTGDGAEEPSVPLPFLELPYFNGLGGFTKDGREYAIYLAPGTKTPAPWANVMANANFGTMVTESGLGFTWRGNSQTNRLTPWQNDPVTDPQAEIIYLRDNDSGACWTP
ncbi:MAG: glucoamylase family protein, partial [Acidobacteriota bacterium]